MISEDTTRTSYLERCLSQHLWSTVVIGENKMSFLHKSADQKVTEPRQLEEKKYYGSTLQCLALTPTKLSNNSHLTSNSFYQQFCFQEHTTQVTKQTKNKDVVYNRLRRRKIKYVGDLPTNILPKTEPNQELDFAYTCDNIDNLSDVIDTVANYEPCNNHNCLRVCCNNDTFSDKLQTLSGNNVSERDKCQYKVNNKCNNYSNVFRKDPLSASEKFNFTRPVRTSLNESHLLFCMCYLLNILYFLTSKFLIRITIMFTCNAKDNFSANRKLYLQTNKIFNSLSRKYILHILFLSVFLSLDGANGLTCPQNCICSPIPSPTLASQKWASLMPSATPTLLNALMNPSSPYAGKLPFLLHPKIINNLDNFRNKTTSQAITNFLPDHLPLGGDSITKIIKEDGSKNKRDIRHFGQTTARSHIQESIIELRPPNPSSPGTVKDETNSLDDYSDMKMKKKIEGSNENDNFLGTNFNLHSYLKNPYRSHLKIDKEHDNYSARNSNSTNPSSLGSEFNKNSAVPRVIEEQIPDLYGGRHGSYEGRNTMQEIQWIGDEKSAIRDPIYQTTEDENDTTVAAGSDGMSHSLHGGNDVKVSWYDGGQIAVVCEMKMFTSVPGVRDDGLAVNFAAIVSLDLSYNNLTNLTQGPLYPYTSLRYLSFRHNQLTTVHSLALRHQRELDTLDLSENVLDDVPTAVKECHKLRLLLLADNKIRYLSALSLRGLNSLQWVDLKNNPLLTVHHEAFKGLPALTKLILKETRGLTTLPAIVDSRQLEVLGIDRAALTSIPDGLCQQHTALRSLNLHLNVLKEVPDLTSCRQLKLLDLSNNQLSQLVAGAFSDASMLHDLLLQNNLLETIPSGAFNGLHQLQVLNLEHNRITFIHADAFLPLHIIEDLNLGNNVFPELPSEGLEHVLYLKVHNNRHLRQFPGPKSFPAVLSLVLSYAYHCCPFLSLGESNDLTYPMSGAAGDGPTPGMIHEDVVFSLEGLHRHDPRLWNQSHPLWPYIPANPSTNFTALWVNLAGRFPAATPNAINGSEQPMSQSSSVPSSTLPIGNGGNVLSKHASTAGGIYRDYPPADLDLAMDEEFRNRLLVQCIPQPGPFMPCRDLFDWWTLRCGVWLVFLLALMGNGVVVVVLVAAYAKMDVPRFLVTNLAMADFLMGVYLGFLAVVDASTLGEFRMYAIPWQMSAGCQLAGFLGVLSSELSVYTLTVITLERNYAIIHAMNLNKRLSLRHAAYIMAIGWMFALSMAILPLAGVSDYRKFAVCLPFETDGAGLGYVVFLMVINGVAFMILMGCYLKIYCAIRGSQAWNSNDSRIAKRMALLVFTDFICWAPIAFFSLSAAYGLQLISLEEAKVFTVFVLPFNSCCNPFLYALLTKQFKKDCVMLCKAIEESRVTRGIGRCRHSSNFSNRQTPVNTNSALDSKSRETCSCGATEKRRARHTKVIDFICCHKTRLSSGTYSKGHRRNLSPKKEVGQDTVTLSNWTWRGRWRTAQKPGPLRLLDLRRPASLDLTRKSSQESSLSSSRHDSSSASTATWRVSRSSVSSDTSKTDSTSRHGSQRDDITRAGSISRHPSRGGTKPRLQRQKAIEKESQGNSKLNCPVHPREELSCVYEQASIEEVAEIKINPSPRFSHRRSLSDGLLFCTLTATQPFAAVNSNTSSLLVRSPTVLPTAQIHVEKQESVSVESDTDKPGLLETHFPLDDPEEESGPKEASPLL